MRSLQALYRQTKCLVPVLAVALYATVHQPIFAAAYQPETADITAEPNASPHQTIYEKLAKLHLPAREEQRLQEEKVSAELEKQADEKLMRPWAWTEVQPTQLAPIAKLQLIYNLFGTRHANDVDANPEVLNDNVFADLELLCGYSGNADNYIIKTIDHTTTTLGAVQLQRLLAEPIIDTETLEKRQAIIKALVSDARLFEGLERQLQRIKAIEDDFLWLYKPLQSSIMLLSKLGQTPSLFDINKSATASEVAKWVGVLAQTLGFAAPILLAYLAYRKHGAVGSAVIMGIHGAVLAYAAFVAAVTANNIRNTMHSKMNSVATLSSACQIMGLTISNHQTFKALFPAYNALSNVVDAKTEQSQELLALLTTDTFKADPSFFARQGRVIAAFNLMRDVQDSFIGTLMTVGQLDAYLSAAKLYKKYARNPRVHYCFVQYEKADKPHLALTKFWHPALNPSMAVANNIELGAANGARDTVITGPNAGGKSTALKSITLCVLLAQCLGIAPASAMTLTPFTKINTYMNIADATGTASLFQAEMQRTSKLLAQIKALKPTEFALVIMDEIFTGTTYKEGQAGAYGVAKKLAGYDNAITLFATHFKVLTELEQATNGVVNNHKVTVFKNADGSFTFPYRLEPGITDQAIALELLAQEGFDADILEAAHEIMDRNKPEQAGTANGA
jgi:DNA mismatch repair protein MutS